MQDDVFFRQKIPFVVGGFAVVENEFENERDAGGVAADAGGTGVVDGDAEFVVDVGFVVVAVVVGGAVAAGLATGFEVEFGMAPRLSRVWPPSWSLLRKVRHYCDGGT